MRQVLPREDGPPGRLVLAPVKLQKVDQELPPGLLPGLACDQRRGHRRDPLLRLCALVELVGLLRLRRVEVPGHSGRTQARQPLAALAVRDSIAPDVVTIGSVPCGES